MKYLVCVDGSQSSLKAVKYAIKPRQIIVQARLLC